MIKNRKLFGMNIFARHCLCNFWLSNFTFTYLRSSIVRSAELQTISITTELFSECCFWIFAHLGQTENKKTKKAIEVKHESGCKHLTTNKKKRKFIKDQNLAHLVSDKRRVCVSSHYSIESRSLWNDTRRPQWLGGSADIDWRWTVKGKWLRLTLQFELFQFDHGALVWVVPSNQVLQVSCTARLWLRGGQNVCDSFLFSLKTKHIQLIFPHKDCHCPEQQCVQHQFSTTTAGVARLTFLFFWGLVDCWSSISFFWGVIHPFCKTNT